MEFNGEFLIQSGIHIITGILILIVFMILAKSSEKALIKRATDNNKVKPSLALVILGHILYYVISFIGFLLILRIFGVEIASIVAIVSAIGFAIGLSLQGTLSDIASGILLSFFKVYEINDIIIVGETEGKVMDFRLIHTVLEEVSSKNIVFVPNRKIQESIVQNLTKQGYHYFVLDFLVSNKNKDFSSILDKIRSELKKKERFPDVIQDMRHGISISDMTKFGTMMRIRVPMTTDGDIAIKRSGIRNELKKVIEENNIQLIDALTPAMTN